MTLTRVRKRDGREVPFDKAKIESAVRRAQAAVGEDDAPFAGDVADVVELALTRRAERAQGPHAKGAVPGIEEIQDAVEQALVELGRAAVAKAYILYRDKRSRIREALEVHEEPGADAGERRAPRVSEAHAVGRWSKGRIAAALMHEADLPREAADAVAAAVEARVFASGLKRISTALIRELVDNELVALGLARALERQRPVAVARHDLRALLDDPGLASEPDGPGPARVARRVEDAVAGLVLRRYALEDLLDERSAELHLAGELHLADLTRPHLDLWRAVPAELCLAGSGAPPAFDLLLGLAPLLSGVAAGVVVEDAASALAGRAREAEDAPLLDAWLAALRALAKAAGKRVDLVPLAPRAGRARARARVERARAVAARLIEALAQDGAPSAGPRLFLDGADLAELLRERPALEPAADRLLAAGVLVPTWTRRPEERFAAPGLRRAPHEHGALALGGAAALNLPRLARRAGPWREERFLEGALELLDAALDALAALAAFQRARRLPQGAPAGRTGYAIAPVGLGEALRWLGDGELRPEQGARALGVLDEALRRRCAARGLTCVLSPCLGRAAGARFAALDAELFQASQGLLFPAAGAHGAPSVAYGSGFALELPHGAAFARAEPGAREGELAAALSSGALNPPLAGLAPEASRLRGESASALQAWRRFEQRRRQAEPLARAPAEARAGDALCFDRP